MSTLTDKIVRCEADIRLLQEELENLRKLEEQLTKYTPRLGDVLTFKPDGTTRLVTEEGGIWVVLDSSGNVVDTEPEMFVHFATYYTFEYNVFDKE